MYAAILEWVIAFGYTLYLLTFMYDLRMTKGVHKHQLTQEAYYANGSTRPSGEGPLINGNQRDMAYARA